MLRTRTSLTVQLVHDWAAGLGTFKTAKLSGLYPDVYMFREALMYADKSVGVLIMYVYRLAAAPKSPLWAVGRATVCAKLANGGAFDIYGLPHRATHVIASERATRIMLAMLPWSYVRTDRLWRERRVDRVEEVRSEDLENIWVRC